MNQDMQQSRGTGGDVGFTAFCSEESNEALGHQVSAIGAGRLSWLGKCHSLTVLSFG